MNGTINVNQIMEESQKGREAAQREREYREDFARRQRRIVEWNALYWWRKAKSKEERQDVMKLYGEILREVWGREKVK
jgi:hypothetical protein